jgi:hypothetical protein
MCWSHSGSQLQQEGSKKMTRNLKVLGLALLAVFALTAVVAQAASAASFNITKSSADVTGTATTAQFLEPFPGAGGSVECQELDLKGKQGAASASSIDLTPTYSECQVAGLDVTVTDNGCVFRFNASGTVDVCPTGGSITVEVFFGAAPHEEEPACTLHFTNAGGANNGRGTVTYSNSGTTPSHITGAASVTNITYEAEGNFCFLAGIETGVNTEGVYNGTATIKSFETVTGTQIGGSYTP